MSPSARNDASYNHDAKEEHVPDLQSSARGALQYAQKNKRQFNPPSQTSNIVESRHENGSYINFGHHASGSGIINNIDHQSNYYYGHSNPLEELEKYCSPSAAFDSAARFNPPRCTKSTRLGIIQIIEEWIGDGAITSSLFWLHGGAGVGKSSLAQSLSEKFQEAGQLGASFFFSRSDPTRNNGCNLIPTLVSHLIHTVEGIAPFVKARIHKNRGLFTKRFETQIRELLIGPLLAPKIAGPLATHPQLIVIDGLDECDNKDVQCELLRAIAGAIPQIPYPFRFLVTSRPEAHITHVFNHDPDLQAITVHRYNLSHDPDADKDIRTFLEKEFIEIRRVHRLGRHLPRDWPDQRTVSSLVERSSGHFIYASTVIGYIRSEKHRPDDRLEVILRLRPPQEGDRPYALLDALYTLIFEGIESHDQLVKICLVIGILYLRAGLFKNVDNDTIEWLLGMKAGDLVLLLDPILSLVAIDGHTVHILHKSLIDYLLDSTRSGHLPFDLAQVHGFAANHLLKQKVMQAACDIMDVQIFAYHCQYAYLDDTLKEYLHSLEVPYPMSVRITLKTPPWYNYVNEPVRSIIWCFLCTLSREDFDSSVHTQYVAKWMHYLRLDFPKPTLTQIGPLPNMHYLQRKFEKLLVEWKPKNFSPMNVEVDHPDDKHVALIKQEHSIFSSYALASFSGNTDMTISSLLFSDYFIHSYDFGTGTSNHLTLQTYSRHSNRRCRGHIRLSWYRSEFLQDTMDYLRRAENYLCSEFYQKYGVEEASQTPGRQDRTSVKLVPQLFLP